MKVKRAKCRWELCAVKLGKEVSSQGEFLAKWEVSSVKSGPGKPPKMRKQS